MVYEDNCCGNIEVTTSYARVVSFAGADLSLCPNATKKFIGVGDQQE